MRRRTTSMLALLGVAGALAGGCGSDEGRPIPASLKQQLDVQLEEAEARLGNGSPGACQDITNDTEPETLRLLDRVPDDVDADVRNALNEGFARLFELVSERCDQLEGERTETTPETETTPPETETTPPTETETETTPTETTPPETETTPEEPTVPDPGNGNGNGNGGGGGLPVPGGDENGAATPPGDEG